LEVAGEGNMASSQIGIIKIPVDGAWDIADLRNLSGSLSETYGLFYPLVVSDQDTRERLQEFIRKQFWSGDITLGSGSTAIFPTTTV
jgi:hypothetical protein